MKTSKTKLYKSFPCTKSKAPFTMSEWEAKFDLAAQFHYQGIELFEVYERPNAWKFDRERAVSMRTAAEKAGIRIHSISRGFTQVNKPGWFDRSVAEMKEMIRETSACGADVLLWVPCRIPIRIDPFSGYEIDYDPGTCRIKTIRDDKNTSYTEYIQLHNEATEWTIRAVEEIAPVAAKEGIKVAIENVGNNLWILSKISKSLLDMFDDRCICAYFDLANSFRYEPVEIGLRTLGSSRIAALHLKDALRNAKFPGATKRVPIGFGDIDWCRIRQTIEEIGLSVWVTPEDMPHYTVEEHSRIIDAFFDGKLTRAFAKQVRDFVLPEV